MTAHVTQDVLENVNSQIRLRHPTPAPLLFKSILRKLAFVSESAIVKSASYDADKGFNLTIPLPEEEEQNLTVEDDEEHLEYIPEDFVPEPVGQEVVTLREVEMPFFYRVCGYVVWKPLKETKVTCQTCVPRLTRGLQDPPHPYSQFVNMSNFKDEAQKEVSDEVFKMLLAAEDCFLRHRNELLLLTEDINSFL